MKNTYIWVFYFEPDTNISVSETYLTRPNMNILPTYREELTSREITVVELVAAGNSNHQIADTLFISIHTVKTHRKKINQKLNTSNSAELTMLAIQMKIVVIR